MNDKLRKLISLFKEDISLLISISLGVFLFVLFFQPFSLEGLDSNNYLLFIAGLGAIVFIIMLLVRVAFSKIIFYNLQNKKESVLPPYLEGIIIMGLSSVAFAFYLHYVGNANITFYMMFKVALINTVPPLILSLYNTFKSLRKQNNLLLKEIRIITGKVNKFEEDYLNKSLEFVSDNRSEKLKLLIADVAFIKSADNYVEVIFKDGDNFNKKLLRNTLKNIEYQMKQFSVFIRCHRNCIVNTNYIEKLIKVDNNHNLVIKEYNELIPVSRQYLLSIKELFPTSWGE